MKKLLPFIFPLVALLIVLFLAFRWYSMRTDRGGEISTFGEGIEIEDLSPTDQQDVLRGVGDFKRLNLDPVTPEAEANGQIRYEIKDGRVRFSVTAALPELEQGQYQVWLKEVNGTGLKKAFILENSKSGFMGSAALDETALPVEIVVSKELRPDDTLEEVVLRATLTKEN